MSRTFEIIRGISILGAFLLFGGVVFVALVERHT